MLMASRVRRSDMRTIEAVSTQGVSVTTIANTRMLSQGENFRTGSKEKVRLLSSATYGANLLQVLVIRIVIVI